MTEKLNIVFVLYPNLTQLDFTGPLQVLSRLPDVSVHLAATTLEPVSTDAVLTIPPTTTFADCPPADLLCIPGGFGVDDAINDAALMDFVKREGARAKYVTSVCTGAFVLGAAGLLKGKRATTHWAFHSALEEVGAIPVRERVVRDGNIFTGGGVTAGIDFAFTLAAEIAGEAFASSLQLGIEYDPAPPFQAGSPEKAPVEVLKLVEAFYAPPLEAFRAALARSMDNP
jgi:cyclohexyl-isocyanide hydratase